jgi:hypothetical protein
LFYSWLQLAYFIEIYEGTGIHCSCYFLFDRRSCFFETTAVVGEVYRGHMTSWLRPSMQVFPSLVLGENALSSCMAAETGSSEAARTVHGYVSSVTEASPHGNTKVPISPNQNAAS